MARRAFQLFSQLVIILAELRPFSLGVTFATISPQNDNGNQYFESILLEEDFENVRHRFQKGWGDDVGAYNRDRKGEKNFRNLVQLLIDRGNQAYARRWRDKELLQKPEAHRKPLGDNPRQSLEDYKRHIKEIHDRGDFKLLSILVFGDRGEDVVPADGFYFQEEKQHDSRQLDDALRNDIEDIVAEILENRDQKDDSEIDKDVKWLVPLS